MSRRVKPVLTERDPWIVDLTVGWGIDQQFNSVSGNREEITAICDLLNQRDELLAALERIAAFDARARGDYITALTLVEIAAKATAPYPLRREEGQAASAAARLAQQRHTSKEQS